MNNERGQGATGLPSLDHDEEEVIIFLVNNRRINGGKGPTVKDVLDATGIDKGYFYKFKDMVPNLFEVSAGSDTPLEKRYVSINDVNVLAAERRIIDRRNNLTTNAENRLHRRPVIGPLIGRCKAIGPIVGSICGIIGGICGFIALLRGC